MGNFSDLQKFIKAVPLERGGFGSGTLAPLARENRRCRRLAVDSWQGDARIRNRVGHCRRYWRFHRCQRRWECQGRLQYNANNVFPLNCDPIAARIALCNARVQDGENQIVENWLRGKENSSPAQNERRIFTEYHLEFHLGDFTWFGTPV